MKSKNLLKELVIWLDDMPYWVKFLSKKILHRESLTEEDFKIAYDFFLEENGLKPESTKEKIEFKVYVEDTKTNLNKLRSVKEVRNVNALVNNQNLPIGNNLTIIYGANGTGKSGYVRLLNNIFLSKGDQLIVPNIYESNQDVEYSCKIEFLNYDNELIEIELPKEIEKLDKSSFLIFDSHCMNVHLNEENELHFIPRELEYFEILSSTYKSILNLLELDIGRIVKDNLFITNFSYTSKVAKEINKLSETTDISYLEKLANFIDKDEESLSELNKKLKELENLQIDKMTENISEQKRFAIEFGKSLNDIKLKINDQRIDEINTLINSRNEIDSKLKHEGANQFENQNIKGIGSELWKIFIKSAFEFSKIQHDEELDYPKSDDYCILCQQKLSNNSISLLKKYWNYLASDLQENLDETIYQLNLISKDLINLKIELLKEDSVLKKPLEEFNKEHLTVLNHSIESFIILKKSLLSSITAFEKNTNTSSDISLKFLTDYVRKLDDDLEKLYNINYEKEKERITNDINELADKKKLKTFLPSITTYLQDLRWLQSANNSKIKLNTKKVTQKQKELFDTYVANDYINKFNEECSRLEANFSAEISQRGEYGHTLKSLKIRKFKPGQILSEGEQRALSLADFLTEASFNNSLRGLIFDDPTNSLDHTRRRIIAERLIEEAKLHQIIIFTHDITFYHFILNIAECQKIEVLKSTIRSWEKEIGIISEEMPWLTMRVKERIKKLNEIHQKLIKIEKDGFSEEYLSQSKTWCELLRESWERSIEEIILNDSIQRFAPEVHTNQLKKSYIPIELIDKIEKGMTETSQWIHDQSREIMSPPPKTEKLKEYLETFESFVKQYRKN